jgi:hypothetical protein
MRGLGLTAVFGVVGYILSWGIFVPSELKVFNVIAAAAMMAGYPSGNLVAGKIKKSLHRILILIGTAIVCVGSAIAYVVKIQMGSAETFDVAVLGILLAVLFFSLSFLMPMAGVVLSRSRGSAPSKPNGQNPTI